MLSVGKLFTAELGLFRQGGSDQTMAKSGESLIVVSRDGARNKQSDRAHT